MRHVNNNPLIYLPSFSFSLMIRELNAVVILSPQSHLSLSQATLVFELQLFQNSIFPLTQSPEMAMFLIKTWIGWRLQNFWLLTFVVHHQLSTNAFFCFKLWSHQVKMMSRKIWFCQNANLCKQQFGKNQLLLTFFSQQFTPCKLRDRFAA